MSRYFYVSGGGSGGWGLKPAQPALSQWPCLTWYVVFIANEPGYHNGQVQLLFASIYSVQLPILNTWQSRSFEVLN